MRSTILFSLLLLSSALYSQILQPVSWRMESKQLSGAEFELIFTADVDPGWYIYSQYLESDDGPIRTSFKYDKGDHFELVGKNREEGHKKDGFDEIFGMNVIKYSGTVVFRQKVKVKAPGKPITGYLEYMTCDNERCLPPEEETFSFTLAAGKTAPSGTAATAPAADAGKTTAAVQAPANEPALIAPAGETQSGILDPVKWSAAIKKLNDQEYELSWTANMDQGWSIYSQFTDDNGPIPTAFAFTEGAHYARDGKVEEKGKKKQGPDPLFGGVTVIKYVASPVVFTQKIVVSDPAQAIEGYLTYMTCDDEQCLPPTEVLFRFTPSTLEALVGAAAEQGATGGTASTAGADETGQLLYGGMPKPNLGKPEGDCGGESVSVAKNTGMGKIFLLGFIGGLLALLTPCVFPMIPLTVSFFTKSSGTKGKAVRNASLYGFFILLVYLILSIPFHLMDSINPDILNDISTNVWLNLAFFAIFLFFAFSFFGYYELTLPSSWTNRASQAEGIGGVIGIFFMALTLALVSFSCTGPILGSLLAGALSSDGGAIQLTAGMGGFGLALALPFGLFAAFPGIMQNLPKSGGWLNTVKVVLGFLELALALKFLSNADLVKHWELLTIEPFLGLWILTFLGLAAYLFGWIRFPHDSPLKKLSLPRGLLGFTSLAFVFYLGSGFLYDQQAGSYRPLKLLSGLAPPVCYSWFQPCNCPQNLSCFKDLEEGLTYARQVNKPVMIDFTGHACVNCRKMEEHVWPVGDVYKQLKDDYILISLYVDDKRELPKEQQVEVAKATGGTRVLRTVGQKWSHFQTEYFQTNSQPFYVLISPDGKLLNNPVGYTPDVAEYADFLKCGQDAFNRLAEK